MWCELHRVIMCLDFWLEGHKCGNGISGKYFPKEDIPETRIKRKNATITWTKETLPTLRYTLFNKHGLLRRQELRNPYGQTSIIYKASCKAVQNFWHQQLPLITYTNRCPNEVPLCFLKFLPNICCSIDPNLKIYASVFNYKFLHVIISLHVVALNKEEITEAFKQVRMTKEVH